MKLTVSRIANEKTVEYTVKDGPKKGQLDSFKKVGFQTNEDGGSKWYDITFRGDVPIKVGEAYDFEISERPYTTKAGEQKVSFDAKLPKSFSRGGGVAAEQLAAQFTQMNRKLDAVLTELRMIRALVDTTTSDGNPVPDFSPSEAVASSSGPLPGDEINPEEIPF